jgi:hypothetical protein
LVPFPADQPGAELAPSLYTIRAASARICQNSASGGRGFIRIFGGPQ